MKKNIAGIVALVMLFTFMFAGASLAEEKKINVVTTIFPVYDWAREIVGDSDNVEITMLLDNGVDLHSYQPTAQDIMKVATCDVFAYVGGESDEWVGDALAEAVNPDMVAVNLVEAMGEDIKLEEIVEGMEHEHDHEDEEHEDEEHDHEDEAHEDEEHEDEEEAEYDENHREHCLHDVGFSESCTDARDQETDEGRREHRDHREENGQNDPQRIHDHRRMSVDAVPDHHCKGNADVPGQAFDVHIKELAPRDGLRLKRQRHQHVVFFEVEQVTVRLEHGKDKRERTDDECAQHRRGTDHSEFSVTDTHRDGISHEHRINTYLSDISPNDFCTLLFIRGMPVNIPLTGGKQQRFEQKDAISCHDLPPGRSVPTNFRLSVHPWYRRR